MLTLHFVPPIEIWIILLTSYNALPDVIIPVYIDFSVLAAFQGWAKTARQELPSIVFLTLP